MAAMPPSNATPPPPELIMVYPSLAVLPMIEL